MERITQHTVLRLQYLSIMSMTNLSIATLMLPYKSWQPPVMTIRPLLTQTSQSCFPPNRVSPIRLLTRSPFACFVCHVGSYDLLMLGSGCDLFLVFFLWFLSPNPFPLRLMAVLTQYDTIKPSFWSMKCHTMDQVVSSYVSKWNIICLWLKLPCHLIRWWLSFYVTVWSQIIGTW